MTDAIAGLERNRGLYFDGEYDLVGTPRDAPVSSTIMSPGGRSKATFA